MTESVKNCIEQAERFLVLREHNKNELIDKLKNKDYEQDVIDQAISFLIDTDELNEKRYILAFIKSSNRKHPEGKSMLFMRLLSKKADKELSKQLLEEIYTEDYVLDLLKEAEKKLQKKGKTADKYQMKQALMKLGFLSSEISRLFSENEQ